MMTSHVLCNVMHKQSVITVDENVYILFEGYLKLHIKSLKKLQITTVDLSLIICISMG